MDDPAHAARARIVLSARMAVVIQVRRPFGGFTLDVEIASDAGVVGLFGPSGAGKSTLLQIVAGLDREARGRVVLGGQVLQESATGIFVPPHRRSVGYVFQEDRLFPHLSVRRNLLYGAWFRRHEPRLATFDEVVDVLGIGHLTTRGVSGLSGGEKQRVAIGRALLSAPKILLLDEPLAALDDARKAETLPYLERLRDHFRLPILYVSHDRQEVDRLADEIIHLSNGKVLGVEGRHTPE